MEAVRGPRRLVTGYIQQNPVVGPALRHDVHAGSLVFILDLCQPLDSLFAGLHKTHRNELRRVLASDLPVVSDKERLKPVICSLYPRMIDGMRVAPVYRFSEQTIGALMDSEAAVAVGVA
jgi:hypothetical protein